MFKLLSFRSDAAFWPLPERGEGGARAGVVARLLAALLAAPRRVVTAAAAEMAARRAMRTLEGLDERLLKDIGIAHGEIGSAVRRGRHALAASDPRASAVRWL